MRPGYRFVDRWVVPTPIERVYDAIGEVRGYERWWTDAAAIAFTLGCDAEEGPAAATARTSRNAKAQRFIFGTERRERPAAIG